MMSAPCERWQRQRRLLVRAARGLPTLLMSVCPNPDCNAPPHSTLIFDPPTLIGATPPVWWCHFMCVL